MQFEPKPLHIHQNSYKTLQKLKKIILIRNNTLLKYYGFILKIFCCCLVYK